MIGNIKLLAMLHVTKKWKQITSRDTYDQKTTSVSNPYPYESIYVRTLYIATRQ